MGIRTYMQFGLSSLRDKQWKGVGNLKKIKAFLCSSIILGLGTLAVPAYAANAPIWQKLKEKNNNPDNWKFAWGILDGPLGILIQIIFILGILILVGAAIFIGVFAFRAFFGKSGISKTVVKIFIVGVVIGVLFTSGGWIGIMEATDKLGVDPATQILTEQNSGQSNQGNKSKGDN